MQSTPEKPPSLDDKRTTIKKRMEDCQKILDATKSSVRKGPRDRPGDRSNMVMKPVVLNPSQESTEDEKEHFDDTAQDHANVRDNDRKSNGYSSGNSNSDISGVPESCVVDEGNIGRDTFVVRNGQAVRNTLETTDEKNLGDLASHPNLAGCKTKCPEDEAQNERKYPQLPPEKATCKWSEGKKFLGWNLKYSKGCDSGKYTFYLPCGKSEDDGGKYWNRDFVRSEESARYITAQYCGWEVGGEVVKKFRQAIEREDAREWEKGILEEKEVQTRRTRAATSKSDCSYDSSGQVSDRETNTESSQLCVDTSEGSEENEKTVINLITPHSAKGSVEPVHGKAKQAKKRKTEGSKPMKTTTSSTALAKEVLSIALPNVDTGKYVEKLSKVLSGSLEVCRTYLNEEDLEFMTLVDRRAVWSAISRDERVEDQFRKMLLEAIPNISQSDLNRYTENLIREKYEVTDFEDVEMMDLSFMGKAHLRKVMAAFGPSKKRRKIS